MTQKRTTKFRAFPHIPEKMANKEIVYLSEEKIKVFLFFSPLVFLVTSHYNRISCLSKPNVQCSVISFLGTESRFFPLLTLLIQAVPLVKKKLSKEKSLKESHGQWQALYIPPSLLHCTRNVCMSAVRARESTREQVQLGQWMMISVFELVVALVWRQGKETFTTQVHSTFYQRAETHSISSFYSLL